MGEWLEVKKTSRQFGLADQRLHLYAKEEDSGPYALGTRFQIYRAFYNPPIGSSWEDVYDIVNLAFNIIDDYAAQSFAFRDVKRVVSACLRVTHSTANWKKHRKWVIERILRKLAGYTAHVHKGVYTYTKNRSAVPGFGDLKFR